jgi:hypothetical protein
MPRSPTSGISDKRPTASGGWSTSSAAGSRGRGCRAGFYPAPTGRSCGGDGVTDLKARYGIETDAGARILVRSDGLRHGPPDVIAALARGEPVDPARYYFRTVMRFETAEPTLAWLNRILALGSGAREKHAVRLDVYEVV